MQTIQVLSNFPKLCKVDFSRLRLPVYIKFNQSEKIQFQIYCSFEVNEPTIDNCDFIKNSPKFIKINSKTQLGILYLSINSNIAVSLEAQIYDEDAWRKMLKSI
jgi:hypothetical protein